MARKLFYIIPGGAAAVGAIIIAFTIFSASTAQTGYKTEYDVRKITIDDVSLNVEIADEPAELQKGLMYRDGLADDQGMLFIFTQEEKHGFWMMNMKFSLDIIWLDTDGKVVHIVQGAEPCIDEAHTSLCTFSPDEPAKYVLEVNSGFVKKHAINENSVMNIPS